MTDTQGVTINETARLPKNIEAAVSAKKAMKEARIKLILSYIDMGYTKASEIKVQCEKLDPPVKLPIRTLYRYLGVIKRRTAKAIEERYGLNKTIDELAQDFRNNFDKVSQELWKQYHGSGSDGKTRVKALAEIRKTSEQWLKTMQTLGLVFKAPRKHQMIDASGNPTDPPSHAIINMDVAEMNHQFIAFIKAKFQDPVGIAYELTEKPAPPKHVPHAH